MSQLAQRPRMFILDTTRCVLALGPKLGLQEKIPHTENADSVMEKMLKACPGAEYHEMSTAACCSVSSHRGSFCAQMAEAAALSTEDPAGSRRRGCISISPEMFSSLRTPLEDLQVLTSAPPKTLRTAQGTLGNPLLQGCSWHCLPGSLPLQLGEALPGFPAPVGGGTTVC